MRLGGYANEATQTVSSHPSAFCEECKETNTGEKNIWMCDACYDKWQSQPKVHFPHFHTKVGLKNGIQATYAHIKDIKSRKLAEDGRTVIRTK